MEVPVRAVAGGAANGESWHAKHKPNQNILETYQGTLAVFDSKRAASLSAELKQVALLF